MQPVSQNIGVRFSLWWYQAVPVMVLMWQELLQVAHFLAMLKRAALLQIETDLTTSSDALGTGWGMNIWLGGQTIQVHV